MEAFSYPHPMRSGHDPLALITTFPDVPSKGDLRAYRFIETSPPTVFCSLGLTVVNGRSDAPLPLNVILTVREDDRQEKEGTIHQKPVVGCVDARLVY
jgi:hypothetical protein